MNPYEPPNPQEPKYDPSIEFKCLAACLLSSCVWLLVLFWVPNTIWLPAKLVISIFATVPLVMGAVYGLAYLLFGQEEF